MSDRLDITENMSSGVIRPRSFDEQFKLTGILDFSLVRAGRIIEERRVFNAITNEGKNNFLNRFFNQTGANTSSWYFGLIDAATFVAVNTSDTLASHAGWQEFTDYSDQRKAWGKGSASNQALTNSSPFTFTFTNASPSTVWGAFMTNDPSKTGTTGILWNTVPLNAILPVQQNDVLNCTYTLQL